MARFFGIAQGEEKTAPGIRIRVSDDGERVWMHGKWLDLGGDHAVVFISPGERAQFVRPDGRKLVLGQFPAWIVRGKSKRPAIAAMFSFSQFEGGSVNIA